MADPQLKFISAGTAILAGYVGLLVYLLIFVNVVLP